MAEEIKKALEEKQEQIKQQEKKEVDNVDLLLEIKKLKANTVSKDDYDSLKNEHNKLIKQFIDGNTKQEESKNIDIEKTVKDIFSNKNLTNMEFVEKAVSLRDTILDQEGIDIFAPYGNKIEATDDDFRQADLVADTLRELLVQAEGDPHTFRYALAASIKDDNTPSRRARVRK